MSNIVMTRVDARLVHGQVAGRWIKILKADKVVIVEDEVAKDDFMVEMFNLVAPPGCEIICYTLEEGLAEWNKDKFGTGNTIILFKYPKTAEQAWRAGLKYESLNVAQVPMAPGRVRVHNTMHLSQEEMDYLSKLADDGVNVYNQAVPEDAQTPVKEAIAKLKK